MSKKQNQDSNIDDNSVIATLGLQDKRGLNVHHVYDVMRKSLCDIARNWNDEEAREKFFDILRAGMWLMRNHFKQNISMVMAINTFVPQKIRDEFISQFATVVCDVTGQSKKVVLADFKPSEINIKISTTGMVSFT